MGLLKTEMVQKCDKGIRFKRNHILKLFLVQRNVIGYITDRSCVAQINNAKD